MKDRELIKWASSIIGSLLLVIGGGVWYNIQQVHNLSIIQATTTQKLSKMVPASELVKSDDYNNYKLDIEGRLSKLEP